MNRGIAKINSLGRIGSSTNQVSNADFINRPRLPVLV